MADKNGTYSIHLNNTYQAFDVTAEVGYAIDRTFVLRDGLNVGSSTGVAHVVAPLPPARPLEPDDDEPPNNLVEQYLNFWKASDILNTVRNARTILPIRSVTLMSCIASLAGVAIILNIKTRRSDFHTRTRARFKALKLFSTISSVADVDAISDIEVLVLSKNSQHPVSNGH